MNELTETEKAYLAGFIDGEGCIHIDTSLMLVLVIGQCDEAFLRGWQERTGLGRMHHTNRRIHSRLGREGWKAMYQWRFAGRQAVMLLGAVLPYLKIKAAQANVAIRFSSTLGVPGRQLCGSDRSFREMCRVQLMGLKKGQPAPQVLEVADNGIQQLVLNI